jgi:RNA polymerase sigma-70 factor (ECF subfamily)
VSEQDFVRLTAPHRRALHAHCYRMLGSLHDADDALQETMLRAWRGLPDYEPRAPLAAWLYRIATNVCLRTLEQRARRNGSVEHLEPYPDETGSPEVAAEVREGVGLAYVAALQLLPPKQRAALALCDGLGWSAREAAETLGETVASVTSALQRARERLRRERADGTLARVHAPERASTEAELMRRFQDAWAEADIPAIVELLAPDALLTMPPERMRFDGRESIGEFFATVPLDGRIDRIDLVPARANGQPALAAYARGDDDVPRAYGVMVFAILGERIAGITGFAQRPDLFTRSGLPVAL